MYRPGVVRLLFFHETEEFKDLRESERAQAK